MNKKHFLDYFFTLITIIFVYLFVQKTYGQVEWSLNAKIILLALLFSTIAYVVQVTVSYRWINLNDPQSKVKYIPFSFFYLKGSLARYVPGNVWAYLLRYRYGMRLGIQNQLLVVSMLFEVYWFVLAAAAWSVFLWQLEIWIRWLMFVLLLILIHILWHKFFRQITTWWLKKFKLKYEGVAKFRGLSFSEITIASLYAFLWLGWGLALMIIVNSLAGDVVISFIPATAIFAFSYLVGFLSFFTPSGLGVREVTMVALLSPILGLHLAGVVSIWSRIIYILGEVVALGLVSLVRKFSKK